MIEVYYENGRCANITARLINVLNPDNHVGQNFLLELVKFWEAGMKANGKRFSPNGKV